MEKTKVYSGCMVYEKRKKTCDIRQTVNIMKNNLCWNKKNGMVTKKKGLYVQQYELYCGAVGVMKREKKEKWRMMAKA